MVRLASSEIQRKILNMKNHEKSEDKMRIRMGNVHMNYKSGSSKKMKPCRYKQKGMKK